VPSKVNFRLFLRILVSILKIDWNMYLMTDLNLESTRKVCRGNITPKVVQT
jgi:hypothetical protein